MKPALQDIYVKYLELKVQGQFGLGKLQGYTFPIYKLFNNGVLKVKSISKDNLAYSFYSFEEMDYIVSKLTYPIEGTKQFLISLLMRMWKLISFPVDIIFVVLNHSFKVMTYSVNRIYQSIM